MALYIDRSAGLQNLQNVAEGLAKMKAETIQNKLRQAQLLNQMGENYAAEDALNGINNYGLSSLLAPDTKAWEVSGIADSPAAKEKKSLLGYGSSLNQTLGGLINTGEAGIKNFNIADTAVKNAELEQKKKKKKETLIGREVGDNSVINTMRENAQIEQSNKEADSYNSKLPEFRQSYTGDEPDQLNQLHDDAENSIKFFLGQGDEKSAMMVWNKYLQTGNAIAQHYQHEFKPMDLKYLFDKPKGTGGPGNGAKGEHYLYGNDEYSAQDIFIPDSVYQKGEATIEKYVRDKYPSIYNSGSRVILSGKNTAKNLSEEELMQRHENISKMIQEQRNGDEDWSAAQQRYEEKLASEGKRIAYKGNYAVGIVDMTDNEKTAYWKKRNGTVSNNDNKTVSEKNGIKFK